MPTPSPPCTEVGAPAMQGQGCPSTVLPALSGLQCQVPGERTGSNSIGWSNALLPAPRSVPIPCPLMAPVPPSTQGPFLPASVSTETYFQYL